MKKFILLLTIVITTVVFSFKVKAVDKNDNYKIKDFSKNREVVSDLIESIESDNYSNIIKLKDDSSIFSSKKKYSITLDKADAYYFGKIKNNKPEGEGILFEGENLDEMINIKVYIGNFEKGIFNGYGLMIEREDGLGIENFKEYDKFSIVDLLNDNGIAIYEGNFKNFLPDGYAIAYYNPSIHIDNSYKINIDVKSISYVGKWKKGEYSGKGLEFIPTNKGNYLNYEGKFKKGEYNGKGILYFENGNILYKGNFKNGYYDGKGKLYDENGNLKFEGEFDYGDIK